MWGLRGKPPYFKPIYGDKSYIWKRQDLIPQPLLNHMPPLPMRQPLYLGESAQGFPISTVIFRSAHSSRRRETVGTDFEAKGKLINILMQEP